MFLIIFKFCILPVALPVAMATLKPLHLHVQLQGLIMKGGSLTMPIIRFRKYKVVQFHLHLHYNIDNAL